MKTPDEWWTSSSPGVLSGVLTSALRASWRWVWEGASGLGVGVSREGGAGGASGWGGGVGGEVRAVPGETGGQHLSASQGGGHGGPARGGHRRTHAAEGCGRRGRVLRSSQGGGWALLGPVVAAAPRGLTAVEQMRASSSSSVVGGGAAVQVAQLPYLLAVEAVVRGGLLLSCRRRCARQARMGVVARLWWWCLGCRRCGLGCWSRGWCRGWCRW